MTDLLGAVKRALFFYGADDEWPAMGDGSIIAQGDIACWLRALVAEVERTRDAYDTVLTHANELERENAALRQRIADMDGQHLCAYCSLVIPGASWDALRAHIDVCPKHPLAELRQRHAAEVEAAFREAWRKADWPVGDPDNEDLDREDAAWLASEAKARLT